MQCVENYRKIFIESTRTLVQKAGIILRLEEREPRREWQDDGRIKTRRQAFAKENAIGPSLRSGRHQNTETHNFRFQTSESRSVLPQLACGFSAVSLNPANW